MSKQQKEKFLKFSLKDKKLTRLFHNKNLSLQDSFFINYIYEERQHHAFYYNVGVNGFTCMIANHFLFKNNSSFFKTVTFGSMFLIFYVLIKKRIDKRYDNLLIPYFEKYQVK